jgi:flagellar motor switch protein FliM
MAAANLNPEEVQALMSAIEQGRVQPATSPPGALVVPYDLTSQDRVIRGQMPTLDAINEHIASMVGIGLAGRTRLAIGVASSPATLLKFLDLQSMLAAPATVAVLGLGMNAGQALLVLEGGVADALLAAALGDRKAWSDEAAPEPRRRLTSVERQVLRRLLSIFTDAMGVAWAPILQLQPELVRFEPDPRLAAIAPPNEAAILCAFELTGGLTGRILLAIPYPVVESVKKQLASPPQLAPGSGRRFSRLLAEELLEVKVELRALLGRAEVNLSRLLELDAGDVLTLDTTEGGPLSLVVQDRPKLLGAPAVVSGGMAFVVQHPLGAAPHATRPTPPRGLPSASPSPSPSPERA